MDITRLSSNGQVIIPKSIMDEMGLEPGMEFVVEVRKGELVLRPRRSLPPLSVDEIASPLKHGGPARILDEPEAGGLEEMRRRWAGKRGPSGFR